MAKWIIRNNVNGKVVISVQDTYSQATQAELLDDKSLPSKIVQFDSEALANAAITSYCTANELNAADYTALELVV